MKNNKPFKILIADDDPDDLDYMNFLFQNHQSFEITKCVRTGMEVIEEINNGTIPDILLTDMYMPMMNGSEIVMELREMNLAKEMSVFIISTVINKNEEEKLRNENVKFLTKPISLAEINDLPELLLKHLNAESVNRI